jgi:hypothetical protein
MLPLDHPESDNTPLDPAVAPRMRSEFYLFPLKKIGGYTVPYCIGAN